MHNNDCCCMGAAYWLNLEAASVNKEEDVCPRYSEHIPLDGQNKNCSACLIEDPQELFMCVPEWIAMLWYTTHDIKMLQMDGDYKSREDSRVHQCCAVWRKMYLISGDIYESYLYAFKQDLRSLLCSSQLSVWLIRRVFGEWQVPE